MILAGTRIPLEDNTVNASTTSLSVTNTQLRFDKIVRNHLIAICKMNEIGDIVKVSYLEM